jgi:hypothetical protein
MGQCISKGKTYSKRTLESDVVLPDTVYGFLGDCSLAIDKSRGDIDWLPDDWNLL